MITYNADRTTPTQFDCSTPSSDLDEHSPPEPYSRPMGVDGSTSENPLMSSLLPGPPPHGVQLMPPGVCSSLHISVFKRCYLYSMHTFVYICLVLHSDKI